MTRVKKMNRLFSLVLVCLLVMACIPVYASAASTRAVSKPTAYAPEAWYDTTHRWSATSYTYSSYIFDCSYQRLQVLATSPQAFSLEIYNASNDNLIERIYSETSDMGDVAYFYSTVPLSYPNFYFILRNQSGTPITVSDSTYYQVNRY